jgi:hypothetical protein
MLLHDASLLCTIGYVTKSVELQLTAATLISIQAGLDKLETKTAKQAVKQKVADVEAQAATRQARTERLAVRFPPASGFGHWC